MDKPGPVGRNRRMSDDAALAARLRGLVRRLEQLDQADRIALGELQELFGSLLAPRPGGSPTDAGEILSLRAENLRLRRMLAALLGLAEGALASDEAALGAVAGRLPPPDSG